MERGQDKAGLVALLKRDALKLGSFTLASGRTSSYYVDGRKVTLSAEGALAIARGALDVLSGYPEVEGVGGLTMGADPIVGAVLATASQWDRAGLFGFLVRKEAKDHGTGQLIEGPLRPGAVVAVLDDVATTGGSSLQAVEAVEAFGAKVAVVIVVLDRLEGAAAAFEARRLPFVALCDVRDLGVAPGPPN